MGTLETTRSSEGAGPHLKHTIKEEAVEEFKLYWLVFAFLAIMFGAFNRIGGWSWLRSA